MTLHFFASEAAAAAPRSDANHRALNDLKKLKLFHLSFTFFHHLGMLDITLGAIERMLNPLPVAVAGAYRG